MRRSGASRSSGRGGPGGDDTAAPVLPDIAWRHSLRLGRDRYVPVGTCDYSVHPKVVGRRIEIAVTAQEVVITCVGGVVARIRTPGRSTAR